jgi:hypothetical protein
MLKANETPFYLGPTHSCLHLYDKVCGQLPNPSRCGCHTLHFSFGTERGRESYEMTLSDAELKESTVLLEAVKLKQRILYVF